MTNKEKNIKYANLIDKMNKAIEQEFYFEAILLEYAILEDRTKSMLRHAKFSESTCDGKLNEKLNTIKNSAKFHDEYVRKHITNELLSNIHNWKNARNKLNH